MPVLRPVAMLFFLAGAFSRASLNNRGVANLRTLRRDSAIPLQQTFIGQDAHTYRRADMRAV